MSLMMDDMAHQPDPWENHNGKESPKGHLLQRKKSESEERFRSLLVSMKESASSRDVSKESDEIPMDQHFHESDDALDTASTNYVSDEGPPSSDDPTQGSEFLFREYDNGKESMNAMMKQSSEQVGWSVFQKLETWNGEGPPPQQSEPQEYPGGETQMELQQPDEWSQGQRSDSNTFASASSAFDAPVKNGRMSDQESVHSGSQGPVVPKPIVAGQRRPPNYARNLDQIHEQQVQGKGGGSSDPWKDLFPLATAENQLGLAPTQPGRKVSKQSSGGSREPSSTRKKTSKKIKLEAMFDDDDSDFFSIGPSVHSRISQTSHKSGDKTVASQGSYHTATSRASASSRQSAHSQRSSHTGAGSAYSHSFNRPPPPPMGVSPQFTAGIPHGHGHPMMGLPYYPQYHHEPPPEAMRYYGNIPPEMMSTVPPGVIPPAYNEWARNNQYDPSTIPPFPPKENEAGGVDAVAGTGDEDFIAPFPAMEGPEIDKDEDERPIRANTKWQRILGVVILLLVVVVVAVVVVLIQQQGQGGGDATPQATPAPAPEPTNPPTLPIRNGDALTADQLKTLIEFASPSNPGAVNVAGSPQNSAYMWAITQLQFYSEPRQMLQRYALATLYYATAGSRWNQKRGWLSDGPECGWFSNSPDPCDSSGDLVSLELRENRLAGDVPPEIRILTSLTSLDLSENSLVSPLPEDLGTLIELTSMNVANNLLLSSIPTQIGRLTGLEVLDLGQNALGGSIPTEVGRLARLLNMNIEMNSLTGFIPTEVGLLTNLDSLDLTMNSIEGAIPSEIGVLTGLEQLELSNNRLEGFIPTEIGSAGSLTTVNLSANSLIGRLPSEVGMLSLLALLDVSTNRLTGSLPTNLGMITTPQGVFKFTSNQFVGSVPTELCRTICCNSFATVEVDPSVTPCPEADTCASMLCT